jgi:hypothetical protein
MFTCITSKNNEIHIVADERYLSGKYATLCEKIFHPNKKNTFAIDAPVKNICKVCVLRMESLLKKKSYFRKIYGDSPRVLIIRYLHKDYSKYDKYQLYASRFSFSISDLQDLLRRPLNKKYYE